MYRIPLTCLSSSQFNLQDERDVIDLLSKCGQDYTSRDSYYYKISSRRMRAKEVGTKKDSLRLLQLSFLPQVQIIPWVISDSNYVKCAAPRLDPQKTVFVGALHGMMTAQGLAMIFQVYYYNISTSNGVVNQCTPMYRTCLVVLCTQGWTRTSTNTQ